jgi:MFS transporter, ACS family, pantothenate transporter
LTYCCLSYFFNYLDRAAFANAYVAGLREDLGLGGSDYNVVLAMFTAKRTAIFTASGQVGSMFSGVMLSAIYKGVSGASLRGWQWGFIINGIITCPVAAMGFLYFPDTPETTRASWLSEVERRLALLRLPPKKADGHNISPRSLAVHTLTSKSLYVLCLFAVISGALEAFVVQNLFLLWLKYYQE